jgi:hypothetical protein
MGEVLEQSSDKTLAEALGERVLALTAGDGQGDLTVLPRTAPFDQLSDEQRQRVEAVLREMKGTPRGS